MNATYTQRKYTTINHRFHRRNGGCVETHLDCWAFPLQKVTSHNLLLPVRVVDDFLDQSFRLFESPTLSDIVSLVYKCGYGGHIFACAKLWWWLVTRLGALPTDCPKYRPVILGFFQDALVLQVNLKIFCCQDTTVSLSWWAWIKVSGFRAKMQF